MIKSDDNILYNWLEYEWVESNLPKYQHYFILWISNLTESQIVGFKKLMNSDYIKH